MRLKIEEAFYSRIGQRQGERSIRMASEIELMVVELGVTQTAYIQAAPLLDRLRRRTLRRHQYEILVAVMTANSLVTGQVDETAELLGVIERMWRKCPASWLPDLRPLRLKILGWLP